MATLSRNRIGIAMLVFSAWALVAAMITAFSYLLIASNLARDVYLW